ncbi:hypothetical protein EMPS_06807 [Entomortierella parvispora]|uniref:Tyr recombinase domain-containing protein n=1 Tax=Entomortierella parvispora TaxID=205924 RepID=A0A9P3HD09_9FUNG|nr:hypothetical protein EMPS_06807 [Entomortierella parvispora]
MERLHHPNSGSQRGPGVVVRPPKELDRTVFPSTTPGRGALHGCERLGLGHCDSDRDLIRTVVDKGKTPVYQLAGTAHSLESDSGSRHQGQGSTSSFRLDNHVVLHHQVRGNTFIPPDGSGSSHLGLLSGDRNPNHDDIHPVRGQPCGHPIAQPVAPDRVVTQSHLLPADRSAVGSPLHRSLCESGEPPAPEIRDVAMGSPGSGDGRPLDPMEAREDLRLPPVGDDIAHPVQDAAGESLRHPSHSPVALGDLVPDPPGPTGRSTAHSPKGRRTRLFSRRESSALDVGGVEAQRQRIEGQGASPATVTIFSQSALARSRAKSYSSPQRAWIAYCSDQGLDAQAPSPFQVLNYLSEQITTKKWSLGTVNAHRSSILNMLSNRDLIWANPFFKEFFLHLSSDQIRDHTNSPVDVSPVLEFFTNLGPNDGLKDDLLVPKLCWLLAVCGFMRPSDIARIDLAHSQVLSSGALELQVLGPKEKRQNCPIIKSVFIHPHDNPLFCPVEAYKSYVARLEGSSVKPVKHPRINREYLPLIRHIRMGDRVVGSQTISRHIKNVSSRIPRQEGSSMPSGRSIGSSLAVEHGASVDEVQAQGFWAHSATFDAFYRLSKRTTTNLTKVTLTGPVSLE